MNCEREVLLWYATGGNASPWGGINRQEICNTYVRPLGHRSGNPSRSLLGIGVPSLLKWPRWSAKIKGQCHRFGPMSRLFLGAALGHLGEGVAEQVELLVDRLLGGELLVGV